LLADLVLLAHAAFVAFAVAGGGLVLRWRKLAWLHLPALGWAVGIELIGGICPLTRLEESLRESGGAPAPATDFVERCISAVLYPANLTRGREIALGVGLLLLNAGIYGVVLRRSR
jgi:hypothetical protein